MPLYELLCLTKPALQRAILAGTLQRVGQLIMDQGGVVTSIRSYGEQRTAKPVRKPFQKFDKAHIWQMNFMASSELMSLLDKELGTDRNVLRWMTVKRADQVGIKQLKFMLKSRNQASEGAQDGPDFLYGATPTIEGTANVNQSTARSAAASVVPPQPQLNTPPSPPSQKQ